MSDEEFTFWWIFFGFMIGFVGLFFAIKAIAHNEDQDKTS